MPSAREINRRIKSVTNTQQITKAMKMVSSVRLRRAQDRALATAPYTEKMEGMLQRLSAASPDAGNPLFTPHDEVKKTCYIVIGSDKGLAGAFNSNVNKAMVSVLKDKPRDASMLLVAGRKPIEYLKHLHLVPEKKWSGFSDKPQFSHAHQIPTWRRRNSWLAKSMKSTSFIRTSNRPCPRTRKSSRCCPFPSRKASKNLVRGKNISSRQMPSSSSMPCCRSIWICSFTTASFSPLPVNSVPA